MTTGEGQKKVLLTSVCRPMGPKYGDASSVGYELLFRQVTRAQGLFSPRALHLHFSLEYVAANLQASTVVLQYPTKRELIRELKKGYDYVGVSFLMAVFHRMKETVALIRRYSPRSKIILGGYGTVLKDDVLAPYADFICREEGVGFMRKLLGEPETPMPYHHPLIVSRLKLFSLPVSRTGMIFAGLGCPNGCDFCCTSHFFKRRHVKLLPRGQDIHAVIERYQNVDPEMSFVVLDEDFLLNKSRALEFRDCVMKSGKVPSVFVFSSIKAISQYTVEEILEMGIDGFWVGYEGTRSGYAKQQGRPVSEIFKEFREHGITILASMIVGFDYQNREVVAEELSGLMDLKPSLAQFLIYGPVPGTPFYERIMREGLLLDSLRKEPELYYRRADGFRTMIKHPTLSPEEIEDIQRWCFKEDFERLGPSVYRVIEAWLLGHEKLKDSPNPLLRQKAACYAREIRRSYPVFLAGRCLGPNAAVRRWIGGLEKRVHAALGTPGVVERCQSAVALGMALWTGLMLKLDWFQHPPLTRSVHRMPEERWGSLHLWEEICRKISIPDLQVSALRHHDKESIWVSLEGILRAGHGEGIGHAMQETLAKTRDLLILDLQKLREAEGEALQILGKKLQRHRFRVKLVLPRPADTHPEIARMSALFKLQEAGSA